jgi:hypothetical protein
VGAKALRDISIGRAGATLAFLDAGELVPGLRPGPDHEGGLRLIMKQNGHFQHAAGCARLGIVNVSPTTYFLYKRAESVHSLAPAGAAPPSSDRERSGNGARLRDARTPHDAWSYHLILQATR